MWTRKTNSPDSCHNKRLPTSLSRQERLVSKKLVDRNFSVSRRPQGPRVVEGH